MENIKLKIKKCGNIPSCKLITAQEAIPLKNTLKPIGNTVVKIIKGGVDY
ncbi:MULTISPECIES: hypothetical protein [unclassified Methanosarcina]|nr:MULTISPECIES: hypothetical protein [unclassified Methanosarcina]